MTLELATHQSSVLHMGKKASPTASNTSSLSATSDHTIDSIDELNESDHSMKSNNSSDWLDAEDVARRSVSVRAIDNANDAATLRPSDLDNSDEDEDAFAPLPPPKKNARLRVRASPSKSQSNTRRRSRANTGRSRANTGRSHSSTRNSVGRRAPPLPERIPVPVLASEKDYDKNGKIRKFQPNKYPFPVAIDDMIAVGMLTVLLSDLLTRGLSGNKGTGALVDAWDTLGTVAYAREGLTCFELRLRANHISPKWMMAVCWLSALVYYGSGLGVALASGSSLWPFPTFMEVVEVAPFVLLLNLFPQDRLYQCLQGLRRRLPGDDDVMELPAGGTGFSRSGRRANPAIMSFLWSVTKTRSLIGLANKMMVWQPNPSLMYVLFLTVVSCEFTTFAARFVHHNMGVMERSLHLQEKWNLGDLQNLKKGRFFVNIFDGPGIVRWVLGRERGLTYAIALCMYMYTLVSGKALISPPLQNVFTLGIWGLLILRYCDEDLKLHSYSLGRLDLSIGQWITTLNRDPQAAWATTLGVIKRRAQAVDAALTVFFPTLMGEITEEWVYFAKEMRDYAIRKIRLAAAAGSRSRGRMKVPTNKSSPKKRSNSRQSRGSDSSSSVDRNQNNIDNDDSGSENASTGSRSGSLRRRKKLSI